VTFLLCGLRYATIEAVFYVGSVQMSYLEDRCQVVNTIMSCNLPENATVEKGLFSLGYAPGLYGDNPRLRQSS
jgi:hypothetical protein